MSSLIVRTVYNIVLVVSFPFVLMRLWFKGQKNSAYRKRLKERLAKGLDSSFSSSIWIHAVSLGEANAATPLVDRLLKEYPSETIVFTTTTPTGSEHVQNKFGDRVIHTYLPYDFSWTMARFIKDIQPKICILMESELWPNLLFECHTRNIPVVVANARISPNSYANYKRFSFLASKILDNVSRVLPQSETDSSMYSDIGIQAQKIEICGNVKFDIKIPEDAASKAEQLRKTWGTNRPVWVAASTHASEEEVVLRAYSRISKKFPDLLLILVPRHPERFNEVAQMIHDKGFDMARRSQGSVCGPRTQVFLGDTLGELMMFYFAADVTFVGGSLVEAGGHNLLEPASAGLPMITGPHLFNILEISQWLKEKKVLLEITNSKNLAEAVCDWLSNPHQREDASKNCANLIDTNKGAVDKTIVEIEKLAKINS